MGTSVHQQTGLRIGVVVTDESAVVYSRTLLLVEAGGKASAKPNALKAPLANLSEDGMPTEFASKNPGLSMSASSQFMEFEAERGARPHFNPKSAGFTLAIMRVRTLYFERYNHGLTTLN